MFVHAHECVCAGEEMSAGQHVCDGDTAKSTLREVMLHGAWHLEKRHMNEQMKV